MEKIKTFKNFNFNSFWINSSYSKEEYEEAQLSNEIIKSVESRLGYKLPQSYIDFMYKQNGGIPSKNCFPTKSPTSWASDHIKISGFLGIGMKKENSLCGEMGNKLMIEEWGYPNIGVYICDCPSGGHDIVMLDYRDCGPNGEPKVVHVDQGLNYQITTLSNDFESFIHGLVDESNFV